MFRKISLFIISCFIFSLSAVCQNTKQAPNTQPDTNKINKNILSVPDAGGGSQANPSIAPGGGVAPIENINKMEMEESPQKSEPVPGAEILIEQSTNDVNYQAPNSQPVKEEKDKKKEKKKKE